MKEKTLIISGFPGVGRHTDDEELKTLNPDVSEFSCLKKGIKNPDFPNNYIDYIKDNLGDYDVIFVSAHKIVRDALKEAKLPYLLVYPNKDLKHVYLENYKNRGDNEKNIEYIKNNWEEFIDDIESDNYPDKIRLPENLYLANILPVILENQDIYGVCRNKN